MIIYLQESVCGAHGYPGSARYGRLKQRSLPLSVWYTDGVSGVGECVGHPDSATGDRGILSL